MLLKLIFAHLIGMGIVSPMNEKNDDRDLYILYIIKEKTSDVFMYEHAYKEEILEYIDTHTFEYNECLRYINEKFVDGCHQLTKNK